MRTQVARARAESPTRGATARPNVGRRAVAPFPWTRVPVRLPSPRRFRGRTSQGGTRRVDAVSRLETISLVRVDFV